MRKIATLFVLILCNFILVYGSDVNNNIRTEKDIKKLLKKSKQSEERKLVLQNDKVAFWNGFAEGRECSYRYGVPMEYYNEIEKTLLATFEDVIIHSKFPKCYFILDENKIGVCKFDGTILVPPVTGVPRLLSGTMNHFLWVGDIVPWIDYQRYCESWVKDKRDIGVGEFKALLKKDNCEVVIPYGIYDFISVTGTGYGKFMVCKKKDDGYKWGMIDKMGNIEISCNYNGLSHEGGDKWAGDNSVDLYTLTQSVRTRITDRIGHFDTDFFSKLISKLNSIGNGIIRLDEAFREYGIYNAFNVENNYINESDYSQIDKNNGGNSDKSKIGPKYNMSEQLNYNEDKATYSKYDSMLSAAKSGNRNASDAEIKNWKKKMKSLREKWEARGKSFPHSANE